MRSLLDLSQNVFIARADQVYTRMREREHRDSTLGGYHGGGQLCVDGY